MSSSNLFLDLNTGFSGGRSGGLVFSLRTFRQFVVIHILKGFHIVSEEVVVVFLEFPCFFYDPVYVGNLISGSLPFLNPACTPGSSQFTYG